MIENLKKALDIRKEIIKSDGKIQEILEYSKISSLGNVYDSLRQEFAPLEQAINEQYETYNSLLDEIRITQDLIIKDGKKKKTEKQGEDYLFIKNCEKNLNDKYQDATINTIQYEKKLELIPEVKKKEMEGFSNRIKDVFEASGVIEHINDSLKDLGEIKKCIKKDPMKALGLYIEFLFEDKKRFKYIENYAKVLERNFESKRENVSKYKAELEKEGRGIADDLKSINFEKELKDLKGKIDKKSREYSPKRKGNKN